MKTWLKTLVASASIFAMVATAGCSDTSGDAYPSKNLELIVPFAAGGGASNFMQQLAPIAAKELGTNIKVSNIEGVGGLIGMRKLAESKPDGYTIGTYNPPATNIAELAQAGNAGVDLREDLEPIAIYGSGGWVMVVPADEDINDLNDVVEKYKSGDWSVLGGEHVGGPTHLIAELMKKQDGLNYKNYVGFEAGEISAAVMRKEVPAAIITDSAALSAVDSGKLKVVGVLYEPGSSFYPDVKTASQQGFSDITYISKITRTLWAPKGVDDEKKQKIADAFKVAIEDPATKKWAEETGSHVEYGTADEATQVLTDAYKIESKIPNIEEILGGN